MFLYKYFSLFKKIDWLLFISVVCLIVFGLAAIYSVALSGGQDNFFSFQKQLLGALIGLAVFFILAFTDFKIFKSYHKIFYILSLILLLAVLFFGVSLRGTSGWFVVGGFGFQPVEFVKLFLLIFLSFYFARFGPGEFSWKHIAISGGLTALLCILVLLQPDLGSAIILVLIWLALLFLRGLNKKTALVLLLLFLLLSSWGWFFTMEDYQKDRLLTFINPERDPLGSGYNITQAIIAVGSGQLWGRGLGFGSQSQLKFLPASQTDFIFAVIAEELGLLGVSLILFFWLIFLWRLIKAAKSARDDFSQFFLLGAVALFLSQMTINIGMNLGIMPVTGLTLPFVSLGSSSLISSLAIAGIAESIIVRR